MKKKCLTLMTVAATLSLAGNAFALVPQNSVDSAAIINGQVMTVDLANNAVTAAKIATGTITGTQMAAGAVATNQLADGAVTDAKIAGPISTSKLNIGTGAGTVAAGNHNHDSLYQKKYGNVIVVAKSGGDYSDPYEAVNSITNASATNPYLVKIMPGVYDIGANSIQMKSFVDIEGSGENTTRILGGIGTTDGALLQGASDAELSHLTLESALSVGYVIYNIGVSPKISHVTVVSTEGRGVYNYISSAIFLDVTVISNIGASSDKFGIGNYLGAPTFTNVNVKAGTCNMCQNYVGIVNSSSQSTFQNLMVTTGSCSSARAISVSNYENQALMTIDGATLYSAWNGIYAMAGMIQITNSTISASNAINAPYSNGTLIANTMLDGAISGVNLKCVSVYDGNFDPLICP